MTDPISTPPPVSVAEIADIGASIVSPLWAFLSLVIDDKGDKGTNNAMVAFADADASAGFSDGLLNSEEAKKKGLTFVDLNGDGYMSAPEIDFFAEADKMGGVVDGLINLKEAKQQGLTFFDGDGDGLMSGPENADVQSGKADVFGAADRAGGVVDDLITPKEAAAQGLMFVDESLPDAPADGFMSRQEYERAAVTHSSTYVAALTTNPDGSNHNLSPEESSNHGLVFFDGNGDGAMSATELFQVLGHKVGGVPPQ